LEIDGRENTFHLSCDGTSGSKELEIEFAKILQESFELFKKKQASYGSGNIGAFLERGVLIRTYDKLQRLKRLVWDEKPNPLNDENIDDTWRDVAVYATIAMICRKGAWK
jgi:hypothetical protein